MNLSVAPSRLDDVSAGNVAAANTISATVSVPLLERHISWMRCTVSIPSASPTRTKRTWPTT
jgi:hypothetical protein